MAKILRDELIDLFILNSPRLAFHRMVAFSRPRVHPFVLENCEYISVDGNLVRDFIKFKICHTICRFTKTNRFGIIQHLENMHKLHNPNRKSTKIQQEIPIENEEPKTKVPKSLSDKYLKTEKVTKKLKRPHKLSKKSNQKKCQMRESLQDERMDSSSAANSTAMAVV